VQVPVQSPLGHTLNPNTVEAMLVIYRLAENCANAVVGCVCVTGPDDAVADVFACYS
jgi:ADP-ribosylglycohydrolase